MPYYINYYSKIRNKIGATEEEFNREVAYNTNRIVTKVLPTNSCRLNEKIQAAGRSMYNAMMEYARLHARDALTIACVGDTGMHNRYYLDYGRMYETFRIPKRTGGYREICAPNEELKRLQQKILRTCTQTMKYLPHNAVHGFTAHRNCKTALETHAAHNARWFLKLDIKDFFPSTTYESVCTALTHVYPFCTLPKHVMQLMAEICTRGGRVPQGAPTSPMITNIVMTPIDVQITEYCKVQGLTYTRYADDVLISSPCHFNWQEVADVIGNILNTGGYAIKREKTRYGNFNGRNWNLGLMYNNQGNITVGHAKKKLIKNMVHNYLTKEELRTPENYMKLLGTVSYCAYIEPEYFAQTLDTLKANCTY